MTQKFHDFVVDDLEARINKAYPRCTQYKEHEYDVSYNHGEVDFCFIKPSNNYAFTFEVKSTDSYKSRHKAYKQLDKDEDFILDHHKPDRIYKFYVCGDRHSKLGYDVSLYDVTHL